MREPLHIAGSEALPQYVAAERHGASLEFFLRLFQLDRAVTLTIATRVWGYLGGVISVSLVTLRLSPVEQGFVYTFGSLLSIKILVEMGLAPTLTQFASHEMADLNLEGYEHIVGPTDALDRLRTLMRLGGVWYGIASLAAFLILLGFGIPFFAASHTLPVQAWLVPWVFLSLFHCCLLAVSPIWAILEGCGLVSEVALRRLAGSVVGNVVCWGMLLAGARLYAWAGFACALVVLEVFWMSWKFRRILGQLLSPVQGTRRDRELSRNVWALQWRVAVSWICGQGAPNLLSAIVFRLRGPIEAGQLGMTFQIATSVLAVPMAWVATKLPAMGRHVARGDYAKMDKIFVSALKRSVPASVCLACSVMMAAYVASKLGIHIASRMLHPLPAAMLLFAAVVGNHCVMSMSSYVRCYKQDPFVMPWLVSSVLLLGGSCLLAKYATVDWVAAWYSCVLLAVNLGYGYRIFRHYRFGGVCSPMAVTAMGQPEA